MPLSDDDQICIDYRLVTTPPSHVHSYRLPTGTVHHFDVRQPHLELSILSEALVDTYRHDTFSGMQFVEDDSSFYASDSTRQRYCEYLLPTQRVQLHEETDRIANVARRQDGVGTASFLVSLTRALHRVLDYKPGATTVDSTILQVLEHKSGVCQDFTHLMLAICRRQGIPARYVSGYLFNGVDRTVLESNRHSNSDWQATELAGTEDRFTGETGAALLGAESMHAWVECLMPDGSWRGFDPTNNLLTNHHYIKVHYGRDYSDVVPLRGVYRGPIAQSMDVSVIVVQE